MCDRKKDVCEKHMLYITQEMFHCCSFQPSASAGGISYPNLDEPPAPPSYELATGPPKEEGGDSSGVGQLIDLGTDITTPVAPPTSQGQGDIVTQLAQLGITAQPSPNTAPPPQQEQPSPADDFDVLARSRTTYEQ